MGIYKNSSGSKGEKIAARYLIGQGYEILETNYQVSGSEVDLIAEKDETICFIEVKTRGTDRYGLPEEFVDDRKQWKMIRAAKIYTGTKRYENYFVRFDIIAVLDRPEAPDINHIQHAFQAD